MIDTLIRDEKSMNLMAYVNAERTHWRGSILTLYVDTRYTREL